MDHSKLDGTLLELLSNFLNFLSYVKMNIDNLKNSGERECFVIVLNYFVNRLFELVLKALDELSQQRPVVVKKLSHYHKLFLVFVDDDISDILVVILEANIPKLHHALITILGSKHTGKNIWN